MELHAQRDRKQPAERIRKRREPAYDYGRALRCVPERHIVRSGCIRHLQGGFDGRMGCGKGTQPYREHTAHYDVPKGTRTAYRRTAGVQHHGMGKPLCASCRSNHRSCYRIGALYRQHEQCRKGTGEAERGQRCVPSEAGGGTSGH